MKSSRKKFVFVFLICALAFQFLSTSFFGKDVRLFPKEPESFLSTDTEIRWKKTAFAVLLPFKIILVGPMLPFMAILDEDPPPPFIVAIFFAYWSTLALALHTLINRKNRS